MNCIFCKTIDDEIPSYTVYEDEVVKCFLDINPDSNGHILIVPKKHFQDLLDIDNETFIYIKEIAIKLYKLLQDKLNCDGVTLIQNNGLVQEVKHFHLHLKPCYKEKQEIIPVAEVYNILTH